MPVILDAWGAHVATIARLDPPRTEVLPTLAAHGRILASDLVAEVPAPAFPMSAMDGFAMASGDLRAAVDASCAGAPMDATATGTGTGTVRIPVTSDIAAGAEPVGEWRPGTAARIMTGGRVPDGLDVVIPVELTDADPVSPHAPGHITLDPEIAARPDVHAAPGRHVRAVGEEVAEGQTLARAGELVSAAIVGIALASGVRHLNVEVPRRVAVVMTGDELVRDLPGGGNTGHADHDGHVAADSRGEVLESNGPTLAAGLAEIGCEASIHHVGDDPEALVRLIASLAPDHDLLVTTGGVGSGARDVVKAALREHSDFVHVQMRPGGPQGVGRFVGEGGVGLPMVHLPGTPVGAFAGFHLFVRPLLDPDYAAFELPANRVDSAPPRPGGSGGEGRPGATIVPGILTLTDGGQLTARHCPGPRLRPYAEATCLLIREGGSGARAGDTVRVIPLFPSPARRHRATL